MAVISSIISDSHHQWGLDLFPYMQFSSTLIDDKHNNFFFTMSGIPIHDCLLYAVFFYYIIFLIKIFLNSLYSLSGCLDSLGVLKV